MSRYYFHLFDDVVSIDEEGIELSTIQAAHEVAVVNVIELACAEVQARHLHLDHRIEVTDEAGEVVDTVWFRDVIVVET